MPAKMDTAAGSKFSLFGGQLEGTTLEIVPGQKLVQQWPHGSKVTITLEGHGDTTTVELLHEDIPEDKVDMFRQGWDTHYFASLQKMFGE